MLDFVRIIRNHIDNNGLKLIYVSERSGIPYQRLNRIFNQDSQMNATELLALCNFLKIDPNSFIDKAS